MNASDGAEKHKWTFTGDDFDPLRAAESNGPGADRACADAPVHPHKADAGLGAVGDDRLCDLRRSDQESGFHWRSHVLHPAETGVAENVRSMRVYRDWVITATQEFAEEHYAQTARLARNSNDCNAFLIQEFADGV